MWSDPQFTANLVIVTEDGKLHFLCSVPNPSLGRRSELQPECLQTLKIENCPTIANGFNLLLYMLFFINNTFISNARLTLAKNHVNAKQHPHAELLLFQNYSHFSSTLSPNNNRVYSKK